MKNFKLNREDALFLFVDIQDKLLVAIENAKEVEKNSKILAEVSTITEIPSLITLQYPKGLGPMTESVRQHIKDGIELEKIHFSSMEDDEIRKTLKEKGKRQIILCGIEAHICIFQTARGLIENGYEVFLVSDAVGSRKQSNQKNALQMMGEMGCVITNTETILFDIAGVAGTEEFKKLQNLIK
ncbi:MAG: isochorismatase family protein [Tissierellia bacterium]|nr:isochorismatase family protein [Tissierellia bacterium]